MAALIPDEQKRARRVDNLADPAGANGTPIPNPMTAPQSAPVVTTLPDGSPNYGQQMRNVGGFIAGGVGKLADGMRSAAGGFADANVTAFKHLVSAPGYGLNSPTVQNMLNPAPAAAGTAAPAPASAAPCQQ